MEPQYGHEGSWPSEKVMANPRFMRRRGEKHKENLLAVPTVTYVHSEWLDPVKSDPWSTWFGVISVKVAALEGSKGQWVMRTLVEASRLWAAIEAQEKQNLQQCVSYFRNSCKKKFETETLLNTWLNGSRRVSCAGRASKQGQLA